MSLDGLDVSQWQGPINWPQIPATYQWVAIRALRGLVIDSRFHENWEGARLRGFRYRLAYAYITGTAPRAQAHALLDLVGPLRVGEGMMQDFEDPPVTNIQARDWLEEVEGNTGRPAVEYLGGTLERKRARLTVVGDRPLVWPDYRSEALARATLPDWCDAWQFTDRGSVPGISGPVDLDRVDNPAAFDAATGAALMTFPYGYAGKPQGMGTMLTWNQYLAKQTVYRLHPEFLRRVKALMEEAFEVGIPLGIGTGWRVQPNPPPPGFAKPGNSNHEGFPIGPDSTGAVAADMVPNTSWPWMEAHAARFGLRTFKNVNDEPWHIQPAEIPANRNWRTQPWDLARFTLPDDKPDPQPKPPPPPPPPGDADMILARFQCRDADAAFIGAAVPVDAEHAVPLTVVWADSDTDADYAQWVQHRQEVNAVDARDWTLLGRLPVQDSRKIWVNTDFRQVVPAA